MCVCVCVCVCVCFVTQEYSNRPQYQLHLSISERKAEVASESIKLRPMSVYRRED